MKTLEIPVDLLDEICSVLIKQVGDTRECPHCREMFVPDDHTSQAALEMHVRLSHIKASLR